MRSLESRTSQAWKLRKSSHNRSFNFSRQTTSFQTKLSGLLASSLPPPSQSHIPCLFSLRGDCTLVLVLMLANLGLFILPLHAALNDFLQIGIGIGPEVGPELNLTSTAHPLEQNADSYCFVTPLIVDHDAHASRCGPLGRGPCFELLGASLQSTKIMPWLEPLDMTKEIIISDDSAQRKQLQFPSSARPSQRC